MSKVPIDGDRGPSMVEVPPTYWKCQGSTTATVVIQAHHPVSWYNARAFAMRVLVSDAVVLEAVQACKADYELRWIGHDAGRIGDRRMQFKTRTEDWSDA